MTVLSAQTIRRLNIVSPFAERSTHLGLTYGLGPAGYDIRIRDSVAVRAGMNTLACSIEHFNIPNDVLGTLCDKSSLARLGLQVQNTVLEPGWRGYLTLELTYAPKMALWGSLVLHAGQPIAQVIFHRLDEPTEQPYEGKYQDQAADPQDAIYEF